MHIERIKVLVTLKAGQKVWDKGTIIDAPIPKELISEARARTKSVEILEKQVDIIKEEVEAIPPAEASSPFSGTHTLESGEVVLPQDFAREKRLEMIPEVIDKINLVYVFVDPNGLEFKLKNLWQFCKEHDFLSYGGLNNLVKGTAKSHKGWTYKGTE